MNNEKINSIYDDVNKAKGIVKGYLIGAGAMAGIVLICLIYYIINIIFIW